MAEPHDTHNVSFLPVFDATKEELVAAWQKVVEAVKLPIKLGEAVESVKRGEDGVFVVKTTVATYRARRVVLATGLRGKPRLLAVPGANLEKVHSLLDDPADFAGCHVLVVGGGDSAVEGALSLAEVGATVTLSYRGDGFKRCKQGNQKKLGEMTAANQLTVLLESNVKEFTPDAVTITLKDGSTTTLPNQHAFVLIGADTPVAWLEANNVRFVERPHLYTLGSTEEVVRRIAPEAEPCARSAEEAIQVVLGKPVTRGAGRRMRSVVEHLRDEVTHVATSVSHAFRLSDLESNAAVMRSARTRTPVSGVPVVRKTPTRLVPPDRLTSRAFAPEPTVVTKNPFGEDVAERTSVDGTALRPRVKRDDGTGSYPAFRALPQDRTRITENPLLVEDELDSAFSRVFGGPASAPPARPAQRPNPFAPDDGTTSVDRGRLGGA